MRQINLLPFESRPDHKTNIAVKNTEKILIILLVVYVVIAGSALGASYYLKDKLKKLTDQKQTLSSDLKDLSTVENSTVYIRDRISKYDQLGDINIELENYNDFNKTQSLFPSDAKVDTVAINENSITYKVEVLQVQSFSDILNRLVDSKVYKNITVSNINYSQEGGYSFNLTMNF